MAVSYKMLSAQGAREVLNLCDDLMIEQAVPDSQASSSFLVRDGGYLDHHSVYSGLAWKRADSVSDEENGRIQGKAIIGGHCGRGGCCYPLEFFHDTLMPLFPNGTCPSGTERHDDVRSAAIKNLVVVEGWRD